MPPIYIKGKQLCSAGRRGDASGTIRDRHNVAEHFGNVWVEYSKEEGEERENRVDKGYL